MKKANNKSITILLAGLVLTLIVIMVIAFTDRTPKSNQYEYNGFIVNKFRVPSAPDVIFHGIEFTVGNSLYEIPFRYSPQSLESIVVEDLANVSWIIAPNNNASNYNLRPNFVFLTFDPEQISGGSLTIAMGNLARMLGKTENGIYKLNVAGATTKSLNSTEIPIIDCKDSNEKLAVFKFQLGKENKIYTEKDCIIIQGDSDEGLMQASDRFVMELLGIIRK